VGTTVIHSTLEPAGIERIKIRVQRRVTIVGHKVGEIRFGKTLSKKVTQMTETDDHDVAYVGGEENIIRRVLDCVFLERFRIIMLRDATISLVHTVAKLCVNSSRDLRGGRCKRVHETVIRIILVEYGVFR
jgi:hypothetical protein